MAPPPLLVALVLPVLLTVLASPGHAAEIDPVGTWPLHPRPTVVAHFDPPEQDWAAGHRGVDLAGVPGQQVRSTLPGSVTYAAPLAGRGVVVVDHGSTRTTYEPVSATVSVGAEVSAGDVVGHLEVTGSHCFPRACLHWGWIRGDEYLDPLRLVGGGSVRLLPWGGTTRPTPADVPPTPRLTVACAIATRVDFPWPWAQARGCAWA